jgi:hypothetical protein
VIEISRANIHNFALGAQLAVTRIIDPGMSMAHIEYRSDVEPVPGQTMTAVSALVPKQVRSSIRAWGMACSKPCPDSGLVGCAKSVGGSDAMKP